MASDDFFEKLRRIQLSERRHAVLSQIDDDFYSELKRRLSALSGEGSFEDNREYRNFCQIGRDIIARRKQKIVAKAQRDLSNNQISSEGLASQEREFYLSMVGLLKRMDSVLDAEEHEKKAAEPSGAKAASDDRTFITVKVRMLSDVPEFVSTDLEPVGPFSRSQVVDLPKEVADLLVNRSLASALEEAR